MTVPSFHFRNTNHDEGERSFAGARVRIVTCVEIETVRRFPSRANAAHWGIRNGHNWNAGGNAGHFRPSGIFHQRCRDGNRRPQRPHDLRDKTGRYYPLALQLRDARRSLERTQRNGSQRSRGSDQYSAFAGPSPRSLIVARVVVWLRRERDRIMFLVARARCLDASHRFVDCRAPPTRRSPLRLQNASQDRKRRSVRIGGH